MASFFTLVFACCLRGTTAHPTGIDETSRLIPANTDPADEQPRIVVDHQKLKDKLGNIVRSKEGKMVNVNAQIPFNLHNQALHPRFRPSLSRSASLSTTGAHPGYGDRPSTSAPRSRQPSPTRAQMAPPAPPRRQSASRSSSVYHAPSQGSEAEAERSPILNVRLVRGAPEDAGVGAPFGRRGRKRGRLVAGGPARGRDVGTGGPADGGPSGGPDGAAAQGPGILDLPGLAKGAPTVLAPVSGMAGGGLRPNGDFVIHDAGDISRSWGD